MKLWIKTYNDQAIHYVYYLQSQQPQTWTPRELVWLTTTDSMFKNMLHLVITSLQQQYYNDNGLIHVLTRNTGLFKMIVGVLTTCHTPYTWDTSICIFLFNRTTLQVFVTYLIGALYVHPLWFYKHQHYNRVRSKLFVACQRWWFQWPVWFVPSVPGYLREQEEHKPDPWRNPTERNHMGLHLENEVYCVWQVVKTPTIILNNPVLS